MPRQMQSFLARNSSRDTQRNIHFLFQKNENVSRTHSASNQVSLLADAGHEEKYVVIAI